MESNARNIILSLTSRITPSENPPLSPKEFWTLYKTNTLTDLSNLPNDFSAPVSVDKFRIQSLLERGLSLALKVEGLENVGIWTLTIADLEFPTFLKEKLKDNCPPVIHGFGNKSILNNNNFGVVGSRNITDVDQKVSESVGNLCAKNEITLVSGGAKGVDISSMNGCINAGGVIICVLADSLLKRAKDPTSQELALNDQAVFITNYSPESDFSVGNAMGRNKIIYGLSKSVLVVTSDYEKGGTWSGATEALKNDYSNVLVWRGNTIPKGNKELIKLGAYPVEKFEDLFNARDKNLKIEQMTLEI